jgi:DNA-binding response OmpR family regulator
MLDERNLEYYGNNGIINLTPNESKLLGLLIENKNRIVKLEEICLKVYSANYNTLYKNSIRIVISRVNKKIKDFKIKCKRGVGYYIVSYYIGGDSNE